MISGYGISLEVLTETHLETVRNWRNLPEIAANMEFTQTITAQEQIAWFDSLNKQANYYFIINYKDKQLGLTHLNKFNVDEKSAHAGLFIANKKFFGTGLSFAVSLIILEHGFTQLGLQTIYAKIKTSNKQAMQFNQTLGFEFEAKLNEQFSLYKLPKVTFEEKKGAIDQLLKSFLL